MIWTLLRSRMPRPCYRFPIAYIELLRKIAHDRAHERADGVVEVLALVQDANLRSRLESKEADFRALLARVWMFYGVLNVVSATIMVTTYGAGLLIIGFTLESIWGWLGVFSAGLISLVATLLLTLSSTKLIRGHTGLIILFTAAWLYVRSESGQEGTPAARGLLSSQQFLVGITLGLVVFWLAAAASYVGWRFAREFGDDRILDSAIGYICNALWGVSDVGKWNSYSNRSYAFIGICRAASCLERHALGFSGNSGGLDDWLRKRSRILRLNVEESAKWLVLPVPGSREAVVNRLALALDACLAGSLGDVIVKEDVEDPTPNEKSAVDRLLTVLRTIAAGSLPIGLVLILIHFGKLAGDDARTLITLTGVIAGATTLSLLSPSTSIRPLDSKDFLEALKPPMESKGP